MKPSAESTVRGERPWPDNAATRALLSRKVFRRLQRALGPKHAFRSVRDLELLLSLEDGFGVSKVILRDGEYDDFLCEQAARWIEPETLALDVGGNIGYWSVFMASRCPSARILSFEPEPGNIALFRKNCDLNAVQDRVHLVEKAVGARPGFVELYLSPQNEGDHRTYESGEARASVRVPVTTLDDAVEEFAAGGSQRRVSFVKMDIQGYEHFALQGMTNIVQENRALVVATEFWPRGLRMAGADPRAFLQFYFDRGFAAQRVLARERRLEPLAIEAAQDLCEVDSQFDLVFSRRP